MFASNHFTYHSPDGKKFPNSISAHKHYVKMWLDAQDGGGGGGGGKDGEKDAAKVGGGGGDDDGDEGSEGDDEVVVGEGMSASLRVGGEGASDAMEVEVEEGEGGEGASRAGGGGEGVSGGGGGGEVDGAGGKEVENAKDLESLKAWQILCYQSDILAHGAGMKRVTRHLRQNLVSAYRH